MQALREHQASKVSSLEQQLKDAQAHAARVEAAQVHAVQEQFADDCLKVNASAARLSCCCSDVKCMQ